MKKRKWLTVLLCLTLAVGIIGMVWQLLDYRRGEENDRLAEEIARPTVTAAPTPTPWTPPPSDEPEPEPTPTPLPPDPVADELAAMDLDALREESSAVLGWLEIPGADISYPLVQGEDNVYYLRHSWNGEGSRRGAIFLECQVDPGFTEFNTIIYGHNMRTKAMFSNLDRYAELDYWEACPAVYIRTDDGVRRYEIYAAWKAELDSSPYYLHVTRQELKEQVIAEGLERSVIQTGVVPTPDDQIITLSTCNDYGKRTRWVVQAVLREYRPILNGS